MVDMKQSGQHTGLFSNAGNLQAKAGHRTAYWIDQARKILGSNARRLPVPEVRFDLRGRSAGQAVFARGSRRCHIRLNAQLLISHPNEMLDETVPHEVAHVAIYCLYGRKAKPHGSEWKALMQAFGVDAAACHTLPTEPTRQLRRYRYICGCDEPAWLTSIRHRRAHSGTEYRCRRCGKTLRHDPE